MYVIYCAGEQGRVVLDILRRRGTDESVTFVDDDESLWGTEVNGQEVIGGREKLRNLEKDDTQFIVAFGDEQEIRMKIADRVLDYGFNLFSAIDSRATISDSATLGQGVIVNAESYVGPDAELEDLVLVDSGVSVSHDVTLERGSTLGPNVTIAGGVHVENDAYIGAGATVIDDVAVAKGAFVGAGAVVTSDVPEEETVVGVPATPIDN
jgi:sugar O-acyltransferase (sialic acid O-acetyltransferase NeuD family)